MSTEKPEIFFHVGLGKTASTYLQHSVFPYFKGIKYIPTNQYKKSLKIIEKGEFSRYLVSREFDRQFEDEVKWFCSVHPDAHIIVVFRRQDKWIASQYKRHVKGGFYKEFKDFIDVENNKGFWDRKEMIFMDKIKVIEKYSTQKPLILFHEDLSDPYNFLNKIATYCGATFEKDTVSIKPRHTAWKEKQLHAVKFFRQHFYKGEIKGGRNRWETWLYFRPWWLFFHLIMYFSVLLPKKWIIRKPLIEDNDLKKVREWTSKDWELLKSYEQHINSNP
ncbi:MAG: hypothetical protein ACFHWX_16915 [Bacteroidota bacterium]